MALADWILLSLALLSLLIAIISVVVQLNYWKKKGVPFIKPIPFFGNFKESILGRQREEDVVDKLYQQLEGERFGGIYKSHKSVLMVRDPELIKHILSKDFSAFPSRVDNFHKGLDPLSGNIFNFEGSMWRNVRSLLTPTFTPGKVKGSFDQMQKYAKDLTTYLSEFATEGKPVEMKDILTKFSIDVICSSLFDVQANALKCADSEFYRIARELNDSEEHTLSRFLSHRRLKRFFASLAEEIFTYRAQNGIDSHDFMQGLARLKSTANSSDEGSNLVAAHMYSFFYAGFRKPAAVLTCALYELASNPELQERLYTEIDTSTQECGGLLTNQAVQALPLLDKIVKETLRMHPAEPVLSRVCRQPYTIPGTDVTLDEGTTILIPAKSLHCDPLYFSEPEVFNPDRFDDEVQNSSYLPFGQGPRMCVGFRLGLLHIKVGLASLIANYSFTTSKTTSDPTKEAWLTVTPR
ncbi:probable cytochrome P450 6a14 [Anabrus simplex]|uniref:probable cytochrome P450 6a14 n=1 Tax=Anabrus simplex TaxID=316456 RepID=UPI0035A3C7CE